MTDLLTKDWLHHNLFNDLFSNLGVIFDGCEHHESTEKAQHLKFKTNYRNAEWDYGAFCTDQLSNLM